MTLARVKTARVEIQYDLSRPEDQTVGYDDVLIDGQKLLAFFSAAWGGSGGQLDQVLRQLKSELPSVWEAISILASTMPKSFAFRDAADRVHEVFIGLIWRGLTLSQLDQQALDVAIQFLNVALDWEASVPNGAGYVHKGTMTFYAAISSLRIKNIDFGLSFLEAGEESDRATYALAGQAGGESDRPGTLTLLLDPNPANMLYNDVLALRRVIEDRLRDFAATGGEPADNPLTMADVDAYFLRDPTLRAGAKFTVAYLFWKAYNVDDPSVSRVPRRGAFTKRRRAELLLGVLTTAEQLVRQVEGTKAPTDGYARVVAAVATREWPRVKEKKVEKVLTKIGKGHLDDVGRCLSYWKGTARPGLPAGSPWYLRWIEPGRFLRNKIAHNLETPDPVVAQWTELDQVAWFSLFSAIWLMRKKNPGRTQVPPVPLLPSVGPTTSLSAGLLYAQPSGVAVTAQLVYPSAPKSPPGRGTP